MVLDGKRFSGGLALFQLLIPRQQRRTGSTAGKATPQMLVADFERAGVGDDAGEAHLALPYFAICCRDGHTRLRVFPTLPWMTQEKSCKFVRRAMMALYAHAQR